MKASSPLEWKHSLDNLLFDNSNYSVGKLASIEFRFLEPFLRSPFKGGNLSCIQLLWETEHNLKGRIMFYNLRRHGRGLHASGWYSTRRQTGLHRDRRSLGWLTGGWQLRRHATRRITGFAGWYKRHRRFKGRIFAWILRRRKGRILRRGGGRIGSFSRAH